MLHRKLQSIVEKALSRVPAVALLGPRQVGKTTLAKTIAKSYDAVYLDLEAPLDLLKLDDATGFLEANRGKLVILDEIQRKPDLFPILRGLIDKNRQENRKTGHYLLLGSASMDLMRQYSESLAGRISYLEMSGLNALEVSDTQDAQTALWLRGGFPESFLSVDDDAAMDWLENLIRTYLERDIPQLGFDVPATRLRRLWTMLAHLQGETINQSKLGANLEVKGQTVGRYMDILTDLLLVRRLEPWHANVKKRLVKSPRFYVRDSGILHRLLGIESHDALLSNPVLGKSWEGFVIENIHSGLPARAQTYFYRSHAGAEIDLIADISSEQRWAIEIKHGMAPKLSPSFSDTCQEVQATHKFVVYGGQEEFGVSNDVVMISLKGLMQKLEQVGKVDMASV